MAQRIIVALMYAVGIVAAAFQASGVPADWTGWVGLVLSFIVGFWGKFSSSQTFIAPNRSPWTAEQRKVEAGQ